jgi:hypothetical protein
MNRYFLITVLVAVFAPATLFAQEHFGDQPTPQEEMEHRMHLRNMELELRQREAEMDFEQQMRELEVQRKRAEFQHHQAPKKHPACSADRQKGKMAPFLVVFFIVHILVAVWVYQDIRKRNTGSGIWIVIALLTGLLGALVYAVVRLGDAGQTQS